MEQIEQNSLFVVHQVAQPAGVVPGNYLGGDYEQELDSGEYFEYDEHDEDQQHEHHHEQQHHAIPLQIRVPLVSKQYRPNYAMYYCANRRLQSIPEAPSELSDAISLTPVESVTNASSARSSRILDSLTGLTSGVHTQEDMAALLNGTDACGASSDGTVALALREHYTKMWSDSITPHKLAVRQLLNSPDLPFIDGADGGSTLQTRAASQNDLTVLGANANADDMGNDAIGVLDEAAPLRSGELQSKPLGKSPRFVKKLVGFACCCTPESSKF